MEDREPELGLQGVSIKSKQFIFYNFRGDIYLFDDPLSALDLEVASRLLNTIVEGELKGKTFLFSTNNQGYLKYADKILYLEEGDLKFTGSYQEFQESEFWAKYEFVGKENEANEVRFEE